MFNKFLVKCRNIKLGTIPMNNYIRLVKKIVDLLQHLLRATIKDRVKHNTIFSYPLSSPTHYIACVDNLRKTNVLLP